MKIRRVGDADLGARLLEHRAEGRSYERKKSGSSRKSLRSILENRQRSRAWILKPWENRWAVAKKEVCLVVHIYLNHLIL